MSGQERPESSGTPPPPPTDFFTEVRADTATAEAVRKIKEQHSRLASANVLESALEDAVHDSSQLSALLLTSCNGGFTMPMQKVTVEYLKQTQLLQIPHGLGINPFSPLAGIAPTINTLLDRYLKIRGAGYETLRKMVARRMPYADVRRAVDALPVATIDANWMNHTWPLDLAVGGPDDDDFGSIVYAYVSQACQMNFDVRDFGVLNLPNMTTSDTKWRENTVASATELSNKMRAYTLQSIAAMNYTSVANSALAAWVRAYGLGCGILPATNSATVREYVFVRTFARKDAVDAVIGFERGWHEPIMSVCLNVLALFGLLHLSKDHTYRSGDPNMERVVAVYLKTLEPLTQRHHNTTVEIHTESIVRTGPHPFGLAQTYYVAKALNRNGQIAPALAVRIDVTPPPVQRIMIAQAAAREWTSLPSGEDMLFVYGAQIRTVHRAVDLIKAEAPRYSGLAKLYGYDGPALPPADGMHSANALMPCIYGFAHVVHVDESRKKDGIALALSLDNTYKTQTALSKIWVSAWEKVLESMEKKGIAGFIEQAMKSAAAVENAANVEGAGLPGGGVAGEGEADQEE